MSSLLWSWIFIISLIRPGFALPVHSNYGFLAKRTLQASMIPDNQSRTIFIAIAVTIAVVVVAVIAGIILTIMRHRRKKVYHPEADLASVDRPSWFMVEHEKTQWWSHFQWQSPEVGEPGSQLPEGSRVERIKAALNRKKGKPVLPPDNGFKSLPSPPEIIVAHRPPSQQYPDIPKRGDKAPLHQPAQQPPTSTLRRTLYSRNKEQLRSPPKAILAPGLSRTLVIGDDRRRSPAARRKSWLSRAALRHPFLPLKDTDAPLVSAPPRTLGSDVSTVHSFVGHSPLRPRVESRPKFGAPVSIKRRPPLNLDQKFSPLRPIAESRPKLASPVPVKPASRPPPLNLDEEPRLEIRFGSPRVRIVSPAF